MSIAETLAGIETPDMPEAAAMRYRVMVLETRRLAAAAQAPGCCGAGAGGGEPGAAGGAAKYRQQLSAVA